MEQLLNFDGLAIMVMIDKLGAHHAGNGQYTFKPSVLPSYDLDSYFPEAHQETMTMAEIAMARVPGRQPENNEIADPIAAGLITGLLGIAAIRSAINRFSLLSESGNLNTRLAHCKCRCELNSEIHKCRVNAR